MPLLLTRRNGPPTPFRNSEYIPFTLGKETAIRECTDLKELTPTLVNTLIKRIDVHNSTKDEHGHKHVPIGIYFTAVGIINIPTEEELIAAMEEMREKPLKSA